MSDYNFEVATIKSVTELTPTEKMFTISLPNNRPLGPQPRPVR